MPRVLYLASVDLPHRKARAIQVINTAHALARQGAEVTLVGGKRDVATSQAALEPFGLHPHPRLTLVRVPIARPPAQFDRWYTRSWQASYLLGITLQLPRLLRKGMPDAIVVRDLRLAWLLCRLSKSVKDRLIYEAHDLSSMEAELRGATAESERLRKVESVVIREAGHVVCITSELRRLLTERFGRSADAVAVIPDATTVTVDNVRPDADKRGVYYVGQLYPWKGVDTLIRAAALYSEAEYVIVGGTDEPGVDDRDAQRLSTLADSLHVADRVRFTGWVPYRQVSELLQQATAAVIPLPDTPFGRYFTSPLKLFDYMAAGVPIVASDLPSLRDVLQHERNALLVPPGDPAALASAIKRLNDDPPLAERISKQARLDVRRYSWDERATRLLSVIGSPEGSRA